MGRFFHALGLASQALGAALGSGVTSDIIGATEDVANLLRESADAATVLAQISANQSSTNVGYAPEDATTMAIFFRMFGGIGAAVQSVTSLRATSTAGEKKRIWVEVAERLNDASRAALNQSENFRENPDQPAQIRASAEAEDHPPLVTGRCRRRSSF